MTRQATTRTGLSCWGASVATGPKAGLRTFLQRPVRRLRP